MAKLKRRNKERDRSLAEAFHGAERGHDIPCLFCGWKLTHHIIGADGEEGSDKPKKGFLYSLEQCSNELNWVPRYESKWEKLEEEYEKQELERMKRDFGIHD